MYLIFPHIQICNIAEIGCAASSLIATGGYFLCLRIRKIMKPMLERNHYSVQRRLCLSVDAIPISSYNDMMQELSVYRLRRYLAALNDSSDIEWEQVEYGIATSSGVMAPATGIDGIIDFYSTQEANEPDKRKHMYPLIVRNGNDDSNAATAVLGGWRTLPDAARKHNERVVRDIMENENTDDYHIIIIHRASIDDDYRWEILDSVGNVISTSNVS